MMLYAKAIVGFLIPTLTVLVTQIQNGVTGEEILKSVITGVVTALVVWATPNKEPS